MTSKGEGESSGVMGGGEVAALPALLRSDVNTLDTLIRVQQAKRDLNARSPSSTSQSGRLAGCPMSQQGMLMGESVIQQSGQLQANEWHSFGPWRVPLQLSYLRLTLQRWNS